MKANRMEIFHEAMLSQCLIGVFEVEKEKPPGRSYAMVRTDPTPPCAAYLIIDLGSSDPLIHTCTDLDPTCNQAGSMDAGYLYSLSPWT